MTNDMGRRAFLALTGRATVGLLIGNAIGIGFGQGAPGIAFASWQNGGNLINVAGRPESAWLSGTYVDGSTGRTFLANNQAFKQPGFVRRVKFNVHSMGANTTWTFKVFRYNYTTSLFELVDERPLTLAATTGLQTFDLDTPVAVQQGDVPGFHCVGGRIKYGGTPTLSMRYTAGDITDPNAFSSTLAGYIEMECMSNRPYLAVTGDSILGGNNQGADRWWPPQNPTTSVPTNPGGVITAEPAHRIALLAPGLEYQNTAKGSQKWAWVATANGGYDLALDTDPHTVVIMAGVNDVSGGETWATVEAGLDAVKVSYDASTSERLFICGIMPWTAGSDAQAATIRTWNASLEAWCATNGVGFIPTTDAMGQVRVSTGELDDLKTAYDLDGVHLTSAGVQALAEVIFAAL